MRVGFKFRAQHEGDAQVVVELIIKRSNIPDLIHVKQGDIWLLTTKSDLESLSVANLYTKEAREALEKHLDRDACEYVQEKEGDIFFPIRQFAAKRDFEATAFRKSL